MKEVYRFIHDGIKLIDLDPTDGEMMDEVGKDRLAKRQKDRVYAICADVDLGEERVVLLNAGNSDETIVFKSVKAFEEFSKGAVAKFKGQDFYDQETATTIKAEPASYSESELKTKGAKALGDIIYRTASSFSSMGRDNFDEICKETGERVWEYLFGHFPADKMLTVEALRIQVKQDEDKISTLTDKIRGLEKKLLEASQLEQRLRDGNDKLHKYVSNQQSRECKNQTLLSAAIDLLNNTQSVLSNIQPHPKED